MLGTMARQVMEHYGYELAQIGVRLRCNELFLSAAIYKRKHETVGAVPAKRQ